MAVQTLHSRIKRDVVVEPVSLLDQAMASITGVWIFESTDIDKLVAGLQRLVDQSPFLAGTLRFVDHKIEGSIYERYLYSEIAYNLDSDPGVELEIDELATTWQELESQMKTEREDVRITLDTSMFLPSSQSIPGPPLNGNGPILRIKISKLKCGTVGIGIILPHNIADIWTLQMIMECWADAYHGQFVPIKYAPKDIDKIAHSLDKKDPDVIATVEKAMKRREYDLWASKDRLPPAFARACEGPQELIDLQPLGLPMDMDPSVPELRSIYFTPQELENMYQHVSKATVRLSHYNALCAHLWTCIARAKKLGNEPCTAFTSITLRTRFPNSYELEYHAGCFVDMSYADSVANANIVEQAQKLREAINSFSEVLIPYHLHRLAFNVCASRFLPFTFSRNAVCFTTWVGKQKPGKLNIGGKLIYYSRSRLPFPNFVAVMENTSGNKDKWYENGCYVNIQLAKDELETLLNDESLHEYLK